MAARYFTIGIDSGTQSTKTVLMDVRSGRVVADASARYALHEKPDGSREQDPADWIAAVEDTVCAVVKRARVSARQVLGIGVSGQQHGCVPLDRDGKVIRRAKLWNDSSTRTQAEYLIGKMGGLAQTARAIGNGIPPGFTASKIRWLKENEPGNYARLRLILLPHNYVNYWLTGVAAMEPGDASGTAFYDVARRQWSAKALKALDGRRDLSKCLPPLQASHEIVGTLRAAVARRLGLSTQCVVATGGGDNMMSAIGTGNVSEGAVTASLGTSGTIFAYSDTPVITDKSGAIAAFCSSTGGWLPLICVMNCTVSTELVKKLFGLSNAQLARRAARTKAGADGIVLLPYFSGERTPNVPNGSGVLYGLTALNFTPAHLCRAAMEGAVLSMNYGLELLRGKGIAPTQIRLTGGGARSALWRQMCADVFNVECRTLAYDESAALGGAIQAAWAWQCRSEGYRGIEALTNKYVKLGRSVCRPRRDMVALYKDVYAQQCLLSTQVCPVFDARTA
jgi:D-xylulose kinase